MNTKTFKLCQRIIVVTVAMLVAVSVAFEAPILFPLGVVIAGLLLMSLCRRLTKEIMVDERVRRIDEKAASAAYRVFSILMAMIALTLIMFRTSLPPAFEIIGTTLAYSVCALMLIHLAFYSYYGSRL